MGIMPKEIAEFCRDETFKRIFKDEKMNKLQASMATIDAVTEGMDFAKDLIVVGDIDPIEVFLGDGLDEIIDKIRARAKEVTSTQDISSEKGRKEISSFAYKITRSRTTLDKLGKDLTTEYKKKPKLIDATRKKMRDTLDAIRDDARKLLTDWEDKDKERIAAHAQNIYMMQDIGVNAANTWHDMSTEELHSSLIVVEKIDINVYEEFTVKAQLTKEQAIINIKHGISQRQEHEKAEAERIEAEKKEKAERDAQIAKDAADKARKEAEEKAKQERIEAERAEQERRTKVERDKVAAIQTERERASKFEADKKAAIQAKNDAEKKARIEVMQAKAKAEADKKAAIQAERDRVAVKEAEERGRQQAQEAHDKKKADNVFHQKEINNEALLSAVEAGFDHGDAKDFIKAVAKGQIKHITINY